MNLKNTLQNNVHKNILLKNQKRKARQDYIDRHYVKLQNQVVDNLIYHSNIIDTHYARINISNFYSKNYYEDDDTYRTEFGRRFLSEIPNDCDKQLPTPEELNILAEKLKTYLISEGVHVNHNQGNMKISWDIKS